MSSARRWRKPRSWPGRSHPAPRRSRRPRSWPRPLHLGGGADAESSPGLLCRGISLHGHASRSSVRQRRQPAPVAMRPALPTPASSDGDTREEMTFVCPVPPKRARVVPRRSARDDAVPAGASRRRRVPLELLYVRGRGLRDLACRGCCPNGRPPADVVEELRRAPTRCGVAARNRHQTHGSSDRRSAEG